MEFWLWMIIAVLLCVVVGLLGKVYLMRKSAREIQEKLLERLSSETNTLIDISGHDPYMKRLAAGINDQLKKLRQERHRFQQGDLELKEAVANISHDLRTPLTAILGYLELLKQEEKSETVARYLSIIENRTEALRQLTEELFRYSIVNTVKESERIQMDLRRALEESLLSFYGVMRKKNILPQIHITDQPVERFLDPTAVSRIFSNIISNALKYSDGDLTVQMDGAGRVIFSNTARGLTSVTAGKLFDRFYTVESGRNSTGLGLSIARLLTQRLGGSIQADYQENRISITVEFP